MWLGYRFLCWGRGSRRVFAGGLIGVMEEGIMSGCFVDEDGW